MAPKHCVVTLLIGGGGPGACSPGFFFDKSRVIWCNLGGGKSNVITNLKINNFKEKNQQEIFIAIFLSQINLDEHSSMKKKYIQNLQGGSEGLAPPEAEEFFLKNQTKWRLFLIFFFFFCFLARLPVSPKL